MRRLTAICALSLLVLTACSGSTIAVSTSTTADTEQPVEDQSSSTTTSSPPTIEETAGASPENPLAVGDVGFTYDDFLGAAWEGTITGLIETGPGQFNEEPGRCLLLLGTLTPTSIEDGVVTNGFQTPGISVLADGQQIQAEAVVCDRSPAETAGYGWILEAEVTVGTTYPFFAEIFLAGETPATLEAVVVGNPSSAEALYYEPTVLTTTPTP